MDYYSLQTNAEQTLIPSTATDSLTRATAWGTNAGTLGEDKKEQVMKPMTLICLLYLCYTE